MNAREKQRQSRNFLVKCIAVVGIFTGTVIILRGWGIGQQSNSQFVGDRKEVERSLLPINTILSIAGVTVPPAGGQQSTWASDISSSAGLPATDGLWLVEKKSSTTVVGSFTEERFTPHTVFPERLLQEKLFANGKVWGLTAPGSTAQLLLGFIPANANQLVKLYEFPRSRVVVDMQLAAKDQEIYFAWGDQTDVAQNLSVIKPTGELLPVFSSNYYQITDILAAHPENTAIYFAALTPENSQQAECFRLNLQNNNVTEIVCAAVPNNGQSIGYGLVDNSATKGTDVYKYKRDDSNPDFIFNSNSGQVRRLITHKGERILWLEVTNNGEVSIPVYNLNNLALIKRIQVLPGAEIADLWMIGDKVVVLGKITDAEYRLFVESAEINETSSASSETTISESSSSSKPNHGFVVEQQVGWKMYTLEGCAQNCDIAILKH